LVGVGVCVCVLVGVTVGVGVIKKQNSDVPVITNQSG
jgi:hypothetical protein